jgi:hypothetical protein
MTDPYATLDNIRAAIWVMDVLVAVGFIAVLYAITRR